MKKLLHIILALTALTTFGQTPRENVQRVQKTNTLIGTALSIPLQVETIAALKATVVTYITDGQQVNVVDYATDGDGGGGVFYYDAGSAATDNGGTIIAPTAGTGRWIRNYTGPVNVRWFGASNAGVVDASDKIQAALDAGEGGTVVIPAGSYALEAKLVVPVETTVIATGAVFICKALDSAVTFYTPTADRNPATTYALTVNSTEGAKVVTVSTGDAASFAADQMVYLRDDTTVGGQNPHREVNFVESVDGGTGVITLKAPVNFAYLTANSAFIAPVVPADGITWDGGAFDMSDVPSNPGGSDRDAIYVYWGNNCVVRNVTVYDHPNKPVNFYGTANSSIANSKTRDPAYVGAGEGYGPRLEYSRFCKIENAFGQNVRHGADVTGGSDLVLDGIFTYGRTASNNTGPFLHGLRSKRVVMTNIISSNVEFGVAAGNGTFDWDKDFTITDVEIDGCDTSIFISNGCANFSISSGTITNSVIRDAVIDSSSNGVISEMVTQGASTNPSNYGSIDIGNSDEITFSDSQVSSKAAGYASVRITGTGDVTIRGVDVSHRGTSAAIYCLTTTGNLRFSDVEIINYTAVVDSLYVNGTGGVFISDYTCSGSGVTPASGVLSVGGNSSFRITDSAITGVTEAVRVEDTGAVIPEVDNCRFVSVENGVKLVGTITSAKLQDNTFTSISTNPVVNTAGAAIFGSVGIQGGISGDRGDNNVTLTVGADREVQVFASALTGNKTVTLATTAASIYINAKFRIVRTGLGAFTLDVGGLKTIPSGTAAYVDVMYNGTAWTLVGYGTL